jgi:hypothetical protein
MKGRRFRSALLAVFEHIGEGLMLMGPMLMGPLWIDPWLDEACDDPEQRPMPALTEAERAEWAAMVKRLR